MSHWMMAVVIIRRYLLRSDPSSSSSSPSPSSSAKRTNFKRILSLCLSYVGPLGETKCSYSSSISSMCVALLVKAHKSLGQHMRFTRVTWHSRAPIYLALRIIFLNYATTTTTRNTWEDTKLAL